MHELCDKCDNKKSDGKCRTCSKEEREYFIDRDLCNFAFVRRRAVTMTSKGYYFARKWYGKPRSVEVQV